MPFLIDGYNLYHAAGKFSEEWAHITPMTLCHFIAEDMRRLRDKAVIVFDGGPPRGISLATKPPGYVKIIFSGPDSDADTTLESLIQKNTAPRRLTVVSSDNRIYKSARRRRAKILKTQEYLAALVKRRAAPTHRPAEPPAKRRGLARGELDEWLQLFNLADKYDQDGQE